MEILTLLSQIYIQFIGPFYASKAGKARVKGIMVNFICLLLLSFMLYLLFPAAQSFLKVMDFSNFDYQVKKNIFLKLKKFIIKNLEFLSGYNELQNREIRCVLSNLVGFLCNKRSLVLRIGSDHVDHDACGDGVGCVSLAPF